MSGAAEETGLGVNDVLWRVRDLSHVLVEKGWEQVGLLYVGQGYPLEHGPGLAALEGVVLVEDRRTGGELDQEVEGGLLKPVAVELEQVVCDEYESADRCLLAELFAQLSRQRRDCVLAILDSTTGDEAEAVSHVLLDKQMTIVYGYTADAIHEREPSA